MLVAEWTLGVKNWAHVVVSRVRKLEGLFLSEPLSDNDDCKPPQMHLEMIETLRSKISATPNQVADPKSNCDPDGIVKETTTKMETEIWPVNN